MRVIKKISRSYSMPAAYTLSADELHGMNTAESDASQAARAENIWRDQAGRMVSRPGIRPLYAPVDAGEVLWEEVFAGHRLVLYKLEDEYCLLESELGVRELGGRQPQKVFFRDQMLLLCERHWLIFFADGAITALCEGGISGADTVTGWTLANPYHWLIGQNVVPVPLIRAGASPQGGGEAVQTINLLTPLVRESFRYSEADRAGRRNRFCLSLQPEIYGQLPTDANGEEENLTESQKMVRRETLKDSAKLELRVRVTDSGGNEVYEWQPYTWDARDNINKSSAAFWVQNIHNKELAQDGEDNVRILYYRNQAEAEKGFWELAACTVSAVGGVAGYKDRLFLSGSPEQMGVVWYSEMDTPLYFGTLQYIRVGNRQNIKLMAGQDERLAVMSDEGTFLITGSAAEVKKGGYVLDAVFSVSACLPAPEPIEGSQAVVAGGEVLYLSSRGVCAVTPSGVLDERCVQIRSRRLDGLLEQDVWQGAYLQTAGDWLFVVCPSGRVYLLDTARRVRVSNDPYTTHAYEAYYWNCVPMNGLSEQSGRLCFYNGRRKYCFDKTVTTDTVFENERETVSPVKAVWETHPITGKGVHACNRLFALTLRTGCGTAFRVYHNTPDGTWRLLKDYDGSFSSFDYGAARYNQWTYRRFVKYAVRFPLPFRHKRMLSLRLENDVLGQPFSLQSIVYEYK